MANKYCPFVQIVFVVFTLQGCNYFESATEKTQKDQFVNDLQKNLATVKIERGQIVQNLKQNEFDVLIIGGGATGAGACLEATSRGLKTALIEGADFASGTSSRSTKLAHGGVRYLERAVKKLDWKEFDLVRSALKERNYFLKNAPHLTRSLPILTPVYGWFQAGYYLAGLKLYDLFARKASLGPSEFISKKTALYHYPWLKKEGLKGGVIYYDGQFNDARLNLNVILTAQSLGASAINYMKAVELLKRDDKIYGVRVKDQINQEEFNIVAKAVINATGPYADKLLQMDNKNAKAIMRPSRGTHIVFSDKFSSKNTGFLIPKTKDGRVLFLLPWLGKTLAGTTDIAAKADSELKATNDEIDYIIEHINNYFAMTVSRKDVLAAWSGLRPLVSNSPGLSTEKISRDHMINVSPSNLITIVGGKWTTFRKMGEDVIDHAIKTNHLKPVRDSATENLKLLGAHHYKKELASELQDFEKLSQDIAEHLVEYYGDRIDEVVNIKNKSLRKRLHPEYPFIEAEVIYAQRFEQAQKASDILAQRLRLAFLDQRACEEILPKIIELMREEAQWSDEKAEREMQEALSFLRNMNDFFTQKDPAKVLS